MQKASKRSVHYEPEATGKDYCGACRHYEKRKQPQSTCAVVIGVVNRKGWCEEFSRAPADR